MSDACHPSAHTTSLVVLLSIKLIAWLYTRAARDQAIATITISDNIGWVQGRSSGAAHGEVFVGYRMDGRRTSARITSTKRSRMPGVFTDGGGQRRKLGGR
jgi:hypothetical protein